MLLEINNYGMHVDPRVIQVELAAGVNRIAPMSMSEVGCTDSALRANRLQASASHCDVSKSPALLETARCRVSVRRTPTGHPADAIDGHRFTLDTVSHIGVP
ncbi:hypothetical protein [Kribbella sp. NPDC050459]|uniref:hypothetical protein n=1 Tax=Kribbella sp. NPDC050459 TaxID=3155785 RepID=UPI0033C0072E